MLLDRRKVKFWQKIVFAFMAFLMAAFLVVGYSGVLNGCTFFNSAKSAADEIGQTISQYKTAVAANPSNANAWTKLGENYVLMAGQQEPGSDAERSYWRQAIAAYKKADAVLAKKMGAEVKKQRLEVLNQLVTTYLFLNDSQGAMGAYGKITALTPKDGEAFFNMGSMAVNAGDINTALLAFTRFLELDPESPDAAAVKAWIKQNTPKSTATPSPSPTK